MTTRTVFGFGAHSGIGEASELLRLAHLADRAGLDVLSLSDHPYLGARLDAYAAIAFVLGRTERLTTLVNVTNVPTRPAPMLARTVTSLSALSGGRVVLGMGAGGRWDRIADMGVPRLSPGDAVDAFEEAIVLIRELSGGGPPVTHHGRHYRVDGIEPAPVPAPDVWTGSVGPRSLAATGRVADGWIPGHAADWLSERYRESRPVIDEAAVAVGRDPAEIRDVFNVPARITDQPLSAPRDREGRWLGGSPAQWIEELTTAVIDHGAAGFILFAPDGGTPDSTTLSRWASEVVPEVREATAAHRGPTIPSTTPAPGHD
ncbi:LLM class flavin-dependent oxidoreductase [Actinoplanes derwentensis]|uniref:Flavin-dependent oxidoreductase, luciferase family (Includes alkanesulfonate monooxygenase SsuD and methylene tetrahydromethanopterin reductase) n=1 Tax=Actinoplanes derwentensis TaxID=113562 RepID=A0A1H1TSK3_9ACTN|nr:LLM class flavin-dependent oxidoreductase [Actinoplanes derwentensis]GID85121.1 N5,N10-methylene tetrahydromethanopterin reductase [Actinoplanes derwentensis]SDS63187.1 Flavin-dependent oxidoreductase, luciferase family (includes alkanesulfonate monooxygenase SsuD and methylene tetrahydromethanopterin reductase) [Actinoplanes derwentensis]